MGYACPVCGEPQRDGEHLANHLAFTAMLGNDDHESWLDEHAPGWDEQSPDDLAGRVVEHAPEAEYEEVFEDTVNRGGQHNHGDSQVEDEHGHGPGRTSFDANAARQRGGANLDAEAQQILQEAQELTKEMIESDESDGAEADGAETDSQDNE